MRLAHPTGQAKRRRLDGARDGASPVSTRMWAGDWKVDSKKNPAAEFTIRGFRRSDFHRLWEIDQTCFPRGISYSQFELLTYMRRPRAFTLVAERIPGDDPEAWAAADGVNTVAFIVAEAGRQTGHIITIDVLEEARRSGLGSRLLAAAEERLRELGCRAVVLETAVDNVAALAFYKRHEYFLVRTERGYYATGVDAFVLRKELGDGPAKS
jgi:ribosomal-protein-alanine N-acetyltransferase